MSESKSNLAVFSLESGRAVLADVCRHLGIAPGQHEERSFEDGEHKLRPLESVRGRDVYVVESLFGEPGQLSVNDKLVRLLFFLSTLRDAGAVRVTAVVPYLCYARKDLRTKPRDPVTTRYVAALFEAAGADRVVAMDVHNLAAYENAFRIPCEHVTAMPLFVSAFARVLGQRPVVVVSPDAGGVKRAERFRQALERELARPVGLGFIEKFRSEGTLRGGAVIGDVKGHVAIILDDLIASGATLARAAAACREHGAELAYAAATHGVFAAGAGDILRASALERIFIVNTIRTPRIDLHALAGRVEVLDCTPLLATAIQSLHTDGSVVALA